MYHKTEKNHCKGLIIVCSLIIFSFILHTDLVHANNSIMITTQPKNYVCNIGDQFKATVEASGTGLTYQWQFSMDGGKSWRNSSNASAKTASYGFTVTKGDLGMSYRCVVRDSAGNSAVSEVGRLTEGLRITLQPKSYTVKVGDQFKATVEASGTGLTYQWQFSMDGGKSWRNSSNASAKTASYGFTVTKGDLGMSYRCVISDELGNKLVSYSGTLIDLSCRDDWELPIM